MRLSLNKPVARTVPRRTRERELIMDHVQSMKGHFTAEEERTIIDEINSLEPDILLVGMGSPIQEQWIACNAPRLRVKASFAIGGFFDFLSGEKRRAPEWVRRIGAEWLFRFTQDPATKWQRVFIEIPVFLIRLLAGRLVTAGSTNYGVEGEL